MRLNAPSGVTKGVSMVPRDPPGPYFTYFVFSLKNTKLAPSTKYLTKSEDFLVFGKVTLGSQEGPDPLTKSWLRSRMPHITKWNAWPKMTFARPKVIERSKWCYGMWKLKSCRVMGSLCGCCLCYCTSILVGKAVIHGITKIAQHFVFDLVLTCDVIGGSEVKDLFKQIFRGYPFQRSLDFANRSSSFEDQGEKNSPL